MMQASSNDVFDYKLENYSINGILQFLKTESMKNDIIRSQWDVERAELHARIAFLQGERKGQENLKMDLVRRIKMLEYALEQQNKKITVLLTQESTNTDEDKLIDSNISLDSLQNSSKVTVQGKPYRIKDIKQFLLDNGYKDVMSEIRESRVKQLLCFSESYVENDLKKSGTLFQQIDRSSSSFNTTLDLDLKPLAKNENVESTFPENNDDSPIYDTVDDSSVLDDKYFASTSVNLLKDNNFGIPLDPLSNGIPVAGPNNALGELASLTIANESVESEANPESSESVSQRCTTRVSWSPKLTLRSHLDAVRCLGFHEQKPLLITGSEDNCLKLWNLTKSCHSKKSSNMDMEPVYTFRGHRAPVLSIQINEETLYSSDLNGEIKIWNIPSRTDLYDVFSPSVLSPITLRHPNAVWSLGYQKSNNILLSGSADGTINLWDATNLTDKPPIKSILLSNAVISSLAFLPQMNNNFLVGTTNGEISLINTETGHIVRSFTSDDKHSRIYKVIVHPIKQLIISAHEDRKIRMFDVVSGEMVSSLVAHLNAVTCLSVENKSGSSYLISGSHDCSVRLWDLKTQSCIQETTNHRKKFDESIHDIAVHPTLHYFATAGADAVAKVFV